ncbi:hypothetical protein L209DRAFT_747713 [Thermothelomyces heterothallicus CBS 203.75]
MGPGRQISSVRWVDCLGLLNLSGEALILSVFGRRTLVGIRQKSEARRAVSGSDHNTLPRPQEICPARCYHADVVLRKCALNTFF